MTYVYRKIGLPITDFPKIILTTIKILKREVSINHSHERNGIRTYFLKRKYKSQLNDIPARVYKYIDFIYIVKYLENGNSALYQIIAENTPLF